MEEKPAVGSAGNEKPEQLSTPIKFQDGSSEKSLNSQSSPDDNKPNISNTTDSIQIEVQNSTEDKGSIEAENAVTDNEIPVIDTAQQQQQEQQQEEEEEQQPLQQQQQEQQQEQRQQLQKQENDSIEAKATVTSEQSKDTSLPENKPCDSMDDMDTSSEFVSKDKLIQRCLEALVICLQRFPQHYKSQYRLAHAYLNIDCVKVWYSMEWYGMVVLVSRVTSFTLCRTRN